MATFPAAPRTPGGAPVDRLESALAAEVARFERTHPRAAARHTSGESALLGGVPMPWMMLWPGGFPIIATRAKGARLWDVDGHEHVALCPGDTGALTGHDPDAAVAAAAARVAQGTTLLFPTRDAT